MEEDKYMTNEQWGRMFRNKREMDRLMHESIEYEIMARSYAAAQLGPEGNRAERRKQAACARKAKL